MPRKPDAALGPAIVSSALSLLDEGGVESVKMREVARRAHTTIPTLYERFRDREALLWALVTAVQGDMCDRVRGTTSLLQMAEIIISYFAGFPGRLDLMNRYWPKIMGGDRPRPIVELAQRKFPSIHPGHERSYSLASLLMGTAMLIRTAGPDTSVAKELKQSGLRAVEVLCREM